MDHKNGSTSAIATFFSQAFGGGKARRKKNTACKSMSGQIAGWKKCARPWRRAAGLGTLCDATMRLQIASSYLERYGFFFFLPFFSLSFFNLPHEQWPNRWPFNSARFFENSSSSFFFRPPRIFRSKDWFTTHSVIFGIAWALFLFRSSRTFFQISVKFDRYISL